MLGIGDWMGLANLLSGVAHHLAREFEVPAADCDCRCHCDVGCGEAPVAGDSPGLKVALDTCLATLSARGASVRVLAPTPCPAGRAPICAQLPLGAWLALGVLLLAVGFFLSWVARGCCGGGQRPRTPAGAHLRPGAYLGPATPLALRAAGDA